jgi:enamine deaminase RidA (YjgF/YER057c/UK114 family)
MKSIINQSLLILLFSTFAPVLFASESNRQERTLISSGSKWEEMAAYSRAVVDGDWVFVSGTVGFNSKDSSISEDFDQQMDQIFTNIENALTKAGAKLEDLVRVRCFIVDTKYVVPMSKKLHQYLGNIRPANTTVVTQLAAKGALIEIEVTALKRNK